MGFISSIFLIIRQLTYSFPLRKDLKSYSPFTDVSPVKGYARTDFHRFTEVTWRVKARIDREKLNGLNY